MPNTYYVLRVHCNVYNIQCAPTFIVQIVQRAYSYSVAQCPYIYFTWWPSAVNRTSCLYIYTQTHTHTRIYVTYTIHILHHDGTCIQAYPIHNAHLHIATNNYGNMCMNTFSPYTAVVQPNLPRQRNRQHRLLLYIYYTILRTYLP